MYTHGPNSRLQHSPTPDARFGDYVLGKPLSYICQGPAICTLLNGAFRTRRTQNALVRSKSISGGFEITLLSTGIFLVSLCKQQFFGGRPFNQSPAGFGDFLCADRSRYWKWWLTSLVCSNIQRQAWKPIPHPTLINFSKLTIACSTETIPSIRHLCRLFWWCSWHPPP